jgi:hypothetical protein
LLKRPVGRPAHYVQRFYRSFRYKAANWSHPRRVVAKVEWHPGELFPRVGFYNQRGTAEQWIKKGKGAIKWTRLSCRTFNANAIRLQLHALAYNLGNFLRTLVTPEPIQIGRSRAYARSSSRSVRRSSATVATSLSKWPKLPSRATCSRTFGPTTWVRKPRERCALMTRSQAFWCPRGRNGLHLSPNRRSGLPGPSKTAGIIRRRLERNAHMGNPGSNTCARLVFLYAGSRRGVLE